MGKELGADDAAEGEEDPQGKQQSGDANGNNLVVDSPGGCLAIARGDPVQDRVFPLGGALGEEEAGEHGGDDHGEDQSAEQGEGDGPGHGLEEAAFHRLQGEDGQVGGDDDADGVEDGPLDFVGGFADLLHDRLVGLAMMAEMANDVLDHDDRAVDDHAEVQRAEGEQVGGDVAEVEADGGEHQREGDRDGDDQGAAQVPEEDEEDDDDQDDALGQVVEDGGGGEMEEIAAIEERDDLHAGRENVIVEFLHLGVDSLEGGVGVLALLEEDDAFDDVVVVDELAVLAVNLLRTHVAGAVFRLAGLADLAEADLWTLNDAGDVGDADGRAVGGFEDSLLDVVDVGEEANFLHVDLLIALLDEAAAGVDVIGGDLLLDLLDGEAVVDELLGVEDDLVLAGEAAEAGDVDDAGNAAEGFFELPVFDALELHRVDGGVGAPEGVPVDLADGTPVGADLGLKAGGEGDLAEALEDLLAVPVVLAVVVEDHGDAGEAGEGGGAEMGHVGDARHADLEGDGDLLLDVFGGAAGPLGDDVDVVVGYVGIGFDGEVVEGDDSPSKQEDRDDQNDEAVVQCEIH